MTPDAVDYFRDLASVAADGTAWDLATVLGGLIDAGARLWPDAPPTMDVWTEAAGLMESSLAAAGVPPHRDTLCRVALVLATTLGSAVREAFPPDAN